MSRFKLAAMIVGRAVSGGVQNNVSSTMPTTPSPPSVTDTFSGTLTRNGASTFPSAYRDGLCVRDAHLAQRRVGHRRIEPRHLERRGLRDDQASRTTRPTQGTVVTGTVAGIGTLCARVYDAAGKVVRPAGLPDHCRPPVKTKNANGRAKRTRSRHLTGEVRPNYFVAGFASSRFTASSVRSIPGSAQITPESPALNST